MTAFTCDDLERLSESVAEAWTAGADRDWSVAAGSVVWTCAKTADHAIDCVLAPAVFLASRRTDAYPAGGGWTLGGDAAAPAALIEALRIVTRLHVALVSTTDPSVRAILWRRPAPSVAPPADFPPRAALELALHAHDVCTGIGVPFTPPAEVATRLREHTRDWPFWDGTVPGWSTLTDDADAWADLLRASGRVPISPS